MHRDEVDVCAHCQQTFDPLDSTARERARFCSATCETRGNAFAAFDDDDEAEAA
jgi:hypothetical protein